LLLIGRNQRLEGFLLNVYMAELSIWGKLGLVNKCQKLMASRVFTSEVQKRVSLFEVKEAIPEYKKNMTAGKYLIYPHQDAKPKAEEEEKRA